MVWELSCDELVNDNDWYTNSILYGRRCRTTSNLSLFKVPLFLKVFRVEFTSAPAEWVFNCSSSGLLMWSLIRIDLVFLTRNKHRAQLIVFRCCMWKDQLRTNGIIKIDILDKGTCTFILLQKVKKLRSEARSNLHVDAKSSCPKDYP